MTRLELPLICKSNSDDWLLWDSQLSWSTSDPDVTLCFQYTVLQWIPMLYLWITSLVYIPLLWLMRPLIYHKRGKFNIFKSILIVILLVIHILNLSYAIGEKINNLDPPPAFFLQTILSAISTLIALYINRTLFFKGVHSSGVQFIYWFLQLLATIIMMYSRYHRIDMPNHNKFRTVTVTMEFVVVLIIFLANCFADPAVFKNATSRRDSRNQDENRPLLFSKMDATNEKLYRKPCPETESSFLCKNTFLWITGLVMQGYRRTLTTDDLFELRYEDTCDAVVMKMEREWDREVERIYNKDKEHKYPEKSSRYKSTYQTLEEESEFIEETEEIEFKKTNLLSNQNESDKKPSLLRALFFTLGIDYAKYGVLKLFYDLLNFMQPQLLGLLIGFIENLSDYVWHGFFISICLFLVAMLRTLLVSTYWHGCYTTGMRARTAVIGIVYRKALKLSSSSRKNTTVGEIVNLMSVDAQKLQDVPNFLHLLWSAPITIVFAVYFLWQELGAAVLAGLALMICLIPLNAFIGSKVKKLQSTQMKMKDTRIKLMSEILNGMKILKLYAWEYSFQEKIQLIRDNECRILRSATYLNAVGAVSWFCAPFLVALVSFAAYILTSPTNVLSANKAFVSLALFNILNVPMSMLPGTIVYGIQAYVSVNRINKFLLGEELDLDNVEVSPPNESPIKIKQGEFSWGKSENSILRDINFEVPEGNLVAIVGTVGSGKTSLMSALIGEMNKVSGKVLCRGSVAYVPQQAWCQNASLQDNILFGQPMSMHRYNKVLHACALQEDLKILPAGDQTEVGEKGINLSGGQKQRISLARAVYQDSSVYIFDDPLSAVDSHVGKHIFNEVIGNTGLLVNKTRILVTHNLTFLPKVDRIMVMLDGQISESGTYKELLANNGAFSEYIRTYLEQEEEEEVEEDSEDEARTLKEELRRTISRNSAEIEYSDKHSKLSTASSNRGHRRRSSVRLSKSKSVLLEEAEEVAKRNKKKRLIEEEIVEVGGVKFSVFLSYLKSTTYLFAFIVTASYLLFLSCSIGANLFLSYWSETGSVNGTTSAASRDLFLGVYGGLGLGQTLFILAENFGLAYGTFLASRSLHHLLLKNILRAPNSFFDTTPLGRILNRIGKDIDTVDVNIPTALRIWLATAAGVLGTIIVVSIASPFFLIALFPLMIFYYIVQRFYICTSRQLKRIDSIKRSPIYSHFQESIVGAPSIRAYNVADRFIYKCDQLTDENQMAWYPNIVSYRWLQFNLETIGNFVILLAGVIAVLTRNSIGAGLAGLSVSYSLQITSSLNFMVRMTCDLESYTVAVERIKEYADVEQEADWELPQKQPPDDWPQRGRVEFRNYAVRYRPGLDLVLKNMNLIVESGQKLGIVGRTGAGKSSLTLALFRLIEPAEGTILIDGIDISTLGLHDVRGRLTIIPQDPVLFSGTLRMNLDPFNQYSDGQLWTSLELANLKAFVTKMPEGLEYPVSESGENLSVGQRQLVCLARALLKKTKVLILDEATAAVDLETDELIQNSIRRQFKSCTVLTIAHRLNTIMDYDRVLVLDQGKIREIDSPEKLLANENSIFHGMCKDAGLV